MSEIKKFVMDADAIDYTKVPQKVLNNGNKIPVVGLGTFGSDRFSPRQVAEAVADALRVGYRHIDCAAVYSNEAEIGNVLKEAVDGGLKRDELFVTSKVWNDKHLDVINSCKKSISDLKIGYMDLYLVHWPFRCFHPPGCGIDYFNPDAKPYNPEEYMETWRQMEQLVEMGLVKNIGTSNMTIPKFKPFLRDVKIKPVTNEMELHPHFQQQELFDFCVVNNIQPIGFCPVGSPKRPDRDIRDTDTVVLEDPILIEIAKNHGIHPAIVCIKWALQKGAVPIPFSVTKSHYISNLLCSFNDPLTDNEMEAISKIDKNCRLLRGQTFIWREGQPWEELWDPTGEISK